MTYREELTARDPIRVRGETRPDLRHQDGGLRHARGVKNYQVMRCCRLEGGLQGWTYNHAPMLAFWRGRFFVEYLSNPRTEHQPPSRTLLVHSADGRNWSEPLELFPPLRVPSRFYQGPGKELLPEWAECNCHQRMGFYVSPSGRLLASAFYGISPEIHIGPNNGFGVGRAVREINPDLTLSPVYFLRYNEPGGYSRENTDAFPFFEESPDPGFREACRQFLADRLVVQQWWEEQRLDRDLFTVPGGAALSYYTLPGGDVMGIYKGGKVIRSRDRGETWTEVRPAWSMETNNAKVWGQRTQDGRYVLAYNPSRDGAHRWPLAAVTGENGEDFADMLALVPEISPCRYEGGLKNLGAQYVRGIAEGNPQPEDGKLHLTYSVNKEDIWVLEVPLPLSGKEAGEVSEDFSLLLPGDVPEAWNLYVPKWCGVGAASAGDCHALALTDRDPWDRPRAERCIPPAERTEVSFSLKPDSLREGHAVAVSAEDGHGREAIRLIFAPDGALLVKSGGERRPWRRWERDWMQVKMVLDAVKGEAVVELTGASGEREERAWAFCQPVEAVERVVFSTKETLPWNTLEDSGRGGMLRDLPGDVPCVESRFFIGRFSAKPLDRREYPFESGRE